VTPLEIKDKTSLDEALLNPAVLLYFFHDQCPPCQSLRPKVKTLLENAFPDMQLVLVDSFQHPEITATFNVFGFPTLLGFFEGKEFFRKSKYVSIPELSQVIERPYRLLFSIG
jgi:thioredoxin-like negative regulator of GroEL